MTVKDMQTRAREHAHLAATQSRMKGIQGTDAGVAFMAQGLAMIYGIPLLQAFETVKILLPHAFEHLNQDIAKRLVASTGISLEEAETAIAERRAAPSPRPAQ